MTSTKERYFVLLYMSVAPKNSGTLNKKWLYVYISGLLKRNSLDFFNSVDPDINR